MQKYEKVILKFCIQFFNQRIDFDDANQSKWTVLHAQEERTIFKFCIQLKKLWIFKNFQSYIYKKEAALIEQSMKQSENESSVSSTKRCLLKDFISGLL